MMVDTGQPVQCFTKDMPMALKDEIQAAQHRLAEAVAAKDVSLAASIYADDACLMPQGASSCRGRDEIGAFFAGAFQNGIVAARFTTGEVDGDEMQATEVGRYTLYAAGPGGDRVSVAEGRYLIAWRKLDGAWRIHRDMFNTQ
jgi:uncharacterized protein (TIGR02246 family)